MQQQLGSSDVAVLGLGHRTGSVGVALRCDHRLVGLCFMEVRGCLRDFFASVKVNLNF